MADKKAKDGRLVVQFNDLGPPKHKGKVEWTYDCPFCAEVRGKPDRDGKLKWHPKKHIGSCWKCKTLVVDSGVHDMETVYDLYYRDDTPTRPKLETQLYTLAGWTTPVKEVPWARAYLARRGFDDALCELYNIRSTEHFGRGICLPDGLDEKLQTRFFQMRRMSEDAKLKYTNPTGADKPVYGLQTVTAETHSAFVCEGCFSSIAMNRAVPGWASLATYGKSPSLEQLKTINALPIEEICIVHDGGEIKSLLDTAQEFFSTTKRISFITMPFGQDPNSVSLEECRERFDRYRFVTNKAHNDLLRQRRRKGKLGDMREEEWDEFVRYCRHLRSVGEEAADAGALGASTPVV